MARQRERGIKPLARACTVYIEIEPGGTGSHLTLTQEMDPKWKEYAGRTESGWKKVLDGIAAVA